MYSPLEATSRFLTCLLAASLVLTSATSIAASYTFADGTRSINGSVDHHENDSDTGGAPVHVYIPGTSLGPGYRLESAAAVTGGTADDGTIMPPMTLKAYSSIGSAGPTTDQIWLRSQARMNAEFEITAAGTQSISIAWSGNLHATGDAYAWYNLRVGFNPWNGVYDLMNIAEDTLSSSTVAVNDSRTFTFDFASADVGSIQYLQVYLTTYAELPYGGGTTAGAYADLYDTFRVTGWSSGLASTDGATPAIPAPPALWLLTSGMLALVQLARRGRQL